MPKKKLTKKPPKPPCGYNLFFSFESKKLRLKEKANKRIQHCTDLSICIFPTGNATKVIAKKWREGLTTTAGKQVASLFEMQSKDNLEMYTMNSQLIRARETHDSLLKKYELPQKELIFILF